MFDGLIGSEKKGKQFVKFFIDLVDRGRMTRTCPDGDLHIEKVDLVSMAKHRSMMRVIGDEMIKNTIHHILDIAKDPSWKVLKKEIRR